MELLDRTTPAVAFSIFANDAERLPVRMAAAKTLARHLAALPESKRQGSVRTALIKCELAAKFSQSHNHVDDRLIEVSRLLHQAQVEL